jgi:tRNA pseudouridine13 synthase
MKRVYYEGQPTLPIFFSSNTYNFTVNEIPLTPFSKRGSQVILELEKQNLSTWELIEIMAKELHVNAHDIGYAGLKDKFATTTQFISIPRKDMPRKFTIRNKNIKLLKHQYASKQLKIGDLQGNQFTIILEKMSRDHYNAIGKRLKTIRTHGIPNYFGAQRFGKEGKNFEQAQRVVEGETFIKDKKLRKFLETAYQSHFFNQWLAHRIHNKQYLLNGDVAMNPKTGHLHNVTDNNLPEEYVITGLLPGRKVWRTRDEARKVEEKFDDGFLPLKGLRREAFIKLKDVETTYDETKKEITLKFTLPRGSYATVFLEALANKEL